jgi:WD40 repeat protein/tRNA A-37 threonylcarbamoyl transferase component Bud32
MGAVFKAEHLLMERLVALKVINRALLNKPGVVERFGREVKAAARLVHPNIVHAYDADQAGDCHFLVMEYVEGVTLARLVQEHGPLPVARACEYVRQAALGLQHAFAHGMVHRDIKPQNLMLTPAPGPGEAGPSVVKILDFGLARLASEVKGEGADPAGLTGPVNGATVTASGALLGTPDYIAPEQVDNPHTADIRADLYSLGGTLYYLLTGRPPFPEGGIADRLAAHRRRRPRPLNAFRRDVPPGVQRVLDRLLAKEPGRRYATPGDVARALAPFAEGARPRRLARWAAVAVAALALGWAGWRYGPAVYRLATNQGQLVIETDDPDVEVAIKKGGEQVTITDARTGRDVTLKAGTYQIELVHGKEGLQLSTGEFTLTRGDNVIVRVYREDKARPPEVGTVRRIDFSEHSLWWNAFSADGRYHLACGGSYASAASSRVRVWEVSTGRTVLEALGAGHAVFMPDGKQVVALAPDNHFRVWEVATGREVRRFGKKAEGAESVEVAPDGKLLVTGHVDSSLRLWDPATGDLLGVLKGHKRGTATAQFSPDGKRLVSSSWDERTIGLWDVVGQKLIRMWRDTPPVNRKLAFAADGEQVISYGNGTLYWWDPDADRPVRTLRLEPGLGDTGMGFSRDGRRFIYASAADKRVRLLELPEGRESVRLEQPPNPNGHWAFSPDGRYAAGGSMAGWVYLWRLPPPPAAK